MEGENVVTREVEMVIAASAHFPRTRQGHGSRRAHHLRPACVASGCVRKNKAGHLEYSDDHFQDRVEAAVLKYAESGIKISTEAKKILFG